MQRNGVPIDDTFAEAFPMVAARLIVTAETEHWADVAAGGLTGFATSVIGCKCEAGVEGALSSEETPDGRPGRSILFLTMGRKDLGKRLVERIGQTVLTCVTAACFDGLPDSSERLPVGARLRAFGDGFQASKVIGGARYWRIPVMEGEFLVNDSFGAAKAIGGGNFLILADDARTARAAAEEAVVAISSCRDVILPFPGGIVRSGSKVGSRRYPVLMATTSDPFCPTLTPRVETKLSAGVNSVLEIVLDGLSEEAIAAAMKAGITAACRHPIAGVTAGNYGGKLGPHHFHLRRILAEGNS